MRGIAHDGGENQLAPEVDDFSHIQIKETDAEFPQFGTLEAGQLDVIDARLHTETLQHGGSAHNQDGQIPDGRMHVLANGQHPPDVPEPAPLMSLNPPPPPPSPPRPPPPSRARPLPPSPP